MCVPSVAENVRGLRGYNRRMRKTLIWLTVSVAAVAGAAAHTRAQRVGGTAQAPPADLVLTNGRIVTVDDSRPEAEAIAISKDRIEALGTAAEIVAMVAEAVSRAKPGQWIYGRGWHQEKWTSRPEPNVEGFPTHLSLDNVSPNNPVALEHASGHAAFVNAKA